MTSQDVERGRRPSLLGWRGAAVVGLLAVLGTAIGAYRSTHRSPSRAVIDTSVFRTYPASTMVKDSFQKADSGRYIDTGSFSHPTQLIRQYRLSAPTARADFERWRQANYPPAGWRLKARPDANRSMYERPGGRSHHVLEVYVVSGGPDDPVVTEYGITYSVY